MVGRHLRYHLENYRPIRLQQKLQKFDAALLDYDKIIYLDPSHPYAHINRAIILKKQGHLEEALASYDTASSITPINAEIY